MRIGQISARSGISERMIRHYEKIGLIPPATRRDSGYRDYDQRDVQTLKFIGRARALGFSTIEIGQLVQLWQDRDRSSADVRALALARSAELRRKARELDQMRLALEHLVRSCHGDERADCPIIQELESSDRQSKQPLMEPVKPSKVEAAN